MAARGVLSPDRSSGAAALQDWAVRAALCHAGWLAQAQLGMALTWSWFGGLGGVALWWLLLSLWPRIAAAPCPRSRWALAALAAVGLALAVTHGNTPMAWLGWGLNLLAWSWLCSHAPWTLPPGGTGWLGSGAGMLLALGLAADPSAWGERWPLLAALLLSSPWAARLQPRPGADAHRVDLPMGLMMGSLLPMAQWCGTAGWTVPQAVALHLAAMAAGLITGQALERRGWRAAGPACAVAALAGLAPTAWAMPATAALAACALRLTGGKNPGHAPATALAGSALLLVAGALAAQWGPDALRLVLLPTLALAALRHSLAGSPARYA